MLSLEEINRKLDNLQQTLDVERQSTLGLLIEEVRAVNAAQNVLLAAIHHIADSNIQASLENRLMELQGQVGELGVKLAAVYAKLCEQKNLSHTPRPRATRASAVRKAR
jgi:hypothetical protein